MNAALLIHGCHVQARGWNDIVWGNPQHGIFGRMSKALQFIHGENLWDEVQIIIGTGASEIEGVKECHAMRNFAIEELTHGPFLTYEMPQAIRHLKNAVMDETSQNSAEELQNAVDFCGLNGIEYLFQVSSPTHITRCFHESLKLKEKPAKLNIIPVVSDVPFEGYSAADVVIAEPPHRGDDPQVNLPVALQSHTLVKRMFGARSKAPEDFASEFDALLKKYENR